MNGWLDLILEVCVCVRARACVYVCEGWEEGLKKDIMVAGMARVAF